MNGIYLYFVNKHLCSWPLLETLMKVQQRSMQIELESMLESMQIGTDAREYVDRSTVRLGRRFHDLPFAFLKDNGNFVAHTPISMTSHPLNNLPEPKEVSDVVTKKYVDDLIADNVGNTDGNYQATHTINMVLKSC